MRSASACALLGEARRRPITIAKSRKACGRMAHFGSKLRFWTAPGLLVASLGIALASACDDDGGDDGGDDDGDDGGAGENTGGASARGGASGTGGAGRGGSGGSNAGSSGTSPGGEGGVGGSGGSGEEGGAAGDRNVFRPVLRPFTEERLAGLEVPAGIYHLRVREKPHARAHARRERRPRLPHTTDAGRRAASGSRRRRRCRRVDGDGCDELSASCTASRSTETRCTLRRSSR